MRTTTLGEDDGATWGAVRGQIATLVPGNVFAGRYLIDRKIGEGGMGAVYRAADRTLSGRVVALKLLRPQGERDQAAIDAMLEEGALARDIRHRNVVAVYDAAIAGGQPYLTMEFLEGVSLREWIRRRLDAHDDIPFELAARIVSEVIDGLAAAHERGVIHRDLKPENIFLLKESTDESVRLKLLDFGLAVAGGASAGSARVRGTVRYMSPEQETRPEAVGPPADIFSLSVVFYELLTGVPPAGPWRPPSDGRQDTPKEIDALIYDGLAPRPSLRPQSTADYRARLEAARAAGARREQQALAEARAQAASREREERERREAQEREDAERWRRRVAEQEQAAEAERHRAAEAERQRLAAAERQKAEEERQRLQKEAAQREAAERQRRETEAQAKASAGQAADRDRYARAVEASYRPYRMERVWSGALFEIWREELPRFVVRAALLLPLALCASVVLSPAMSQDSFRPTMVVSLLGFAFESGFTRVVLLVGSTAGLLAALYWWRMVIALGDGKSLVILPEAFRRRLGLVADFNPARLAELASTFQEPTLWGAPGAWRIGAGPQAAPSLMASLDWTRYLSGSLAALEPLAPKPPSQPAWAEYAVIYGVAVVVAAVAATVLAFVPGQAGTGSLALGWFAMVAGCAVLLWQLVRRSFTAPTPAYILHAYWGVAALLFVLVIGGLLHQIPAA